MANKRLSTGTMVLIGVGVLVLIIIFWVMGTYNSLVSANVKTDTQWANVQSSYQRRADLIPNLVETVNDYKNFEASTLTKVTELRSEVGKFKSDWDSSATAQGKIDAANGMEGALSRLLVIVEAYPDLKASTNFLALQDELAGTENRINVERNRYNEAVGEYNKLTMYFPGNMIAGMFGFEKKEFFQAKAGTEDAPTVSFNN